MAGFEVIIEASDDGAFPKGREAMQEGKEAVPGRYVSASFEYKRKLGFVSG